MKTRVYSSKYAAYFRQDRSARLKELKETYGISRLFIFPGRSAFVAGDPVPVEDLAKAVPQVRAAGMEAGIWISNLGMSGTLSGVAAERCKDFTRLRSASNKQADDAFCPLDEKFTSAFCAFVKQLAALHPDIIMLDDDLAISARPGMGCFCDAHLKLFEKKLGRSHTLEEYNQIIFCGGPSPEREAWLEIMGDTMRNFCRAVRKAIDEVDPSIRCGFCTGYTSWDMEGADAIELTKILAGNTAPFLRFTGAPYWSDKDVNRFSNQKLQTAIELTRAQCSWCEGEEIEVFHEGDTCPRPTNHNPASSLECFDIPLMATGKMHRQKYMLDYINDETYEEAYLENHRYNMPLCAFIEKHFEGKKEVGVQVCQHQYKVKDQVFPEEFMGDRALACTFFTPDATAIVANGIPTTYDENPEAGVAFGEECRHLKKLPKKLYTDVKGALILQERGFDCGIKEVRPAAIPWRERFEKYTVGYYHRTFSGDYFACTLDERVEVCSEFLPAEIPASFKYRVGDTELLVICADAATLDNRADLLYNHCRRNQLQEFFSKYPAMGKNPYIYTLVKKDEKETAVLFTNISPDMVLNGTVTLDKEYKEMEIFGIDATLEGNRIKLNAPFYPYQSFAVVLK